MTDSPESPDPLSQDVLAVVGSLAWPSRNLLEIGQAVVARHVAARRPDTMISGGAAGIDTYAKDLATELGIPFHELLPRHRRWAPEGFKERNQGIAHMCTRLLAVRYSLATTFGSGWTANEAARLGRPARMALIHPDGTVEMQEVTYRRGGA